MMTAIHPYHHTPANDIGDMMRSIRSSRPIAIRFWEQVAVGGPDECWLWTGGIVGGYGYIRREDGTKTGAHRVAYEIQRGPVPEGLWVLHNCPTGDNPLCCNARHLWPGTARENTLDMVAKGRNRAKKHVGTENGCAKLTDAQVIEIRIRAGAGETQDSLGKHFGVSQATISRIVLRLKWTHVA